MWFSNRDVSDTAVTIFTMTEAMLMKLQVSFKNYLEFSAENEAKRHCVKSVRIRSYSGPNFPAFGLNTKRYYVSLRIQSKCWKMRTRITPKTDTFYAVRGMQRTLKQFRKAKQLPFDRIKPFKDLRFDKTLQRDPSFVSMFKQVNVFWLGLGRTFEGIVKNRLVL